MQTVKRSSAILHGQLSRVLAEMGHTDELLVTDAGLPIPLGVERVDLALTGNVPRVNTVLQMILGELTVEEAVMAEEVAKASRGLFDEVTQLLPANARITLVPHQEFKQRTRGVRAAVRTGELTWYANIILVGGVSF